MNTFYLIDYENVNKGGLLGSNNLTENDHIIIFFTMNARNIDMHTLANIGNASLQMIEVSAGKQSTDMHIVSYIGFLIGKYPECSIVIISNDTDYDNVLQFWADKRGVLASRTKAIQYTNTMPETTKLETTVNIGNSITKLLKSKYSEVNVTSIVTIVNRYYDRKQKLHPIYTELIAQFGQKEGLQIYKLIKPLIK